MTRSMRTLMVVTCVLFAFPLLKAQGQSSASGTVVVPDSSVEHPGDRGVRSHTNFVIFVPAARQDGAHPYLGGTSPGGEVPASLSCVYQTWAGQVSGCPINGSYAPPRGGSNVIAIVDAYDYPTAQPDFDTFSGQFGLPISTDTCANGQPCFKKVYATGSKPRSNCGWAQEAALDIEWAHAMAPNAQIILVEAASNSNSNLLQAVQIATGLVADAGGGEVSMSWGSSEFSSEATNDFYFNNPGVAYFASSGDTGGKVIWPSVSSYVLSAGGTSVNRSNENFTSETAWSSAGGGPSKYEPIPSYQTGIYSLSQLLGNYRGTPDLSFDADPYTGVSVYDSTSCQGLSGWLVFGGTSVSSPSLAGVVNYSQDFSDSQGVLSDVYATYNTTSKGGAQLSCGYTSPLYDVTGGSAGSYSATGCWDFASGIGTPRGLSGSGGTSGSFSLSASASSVSVAQSSSVTDDITVTPTGGFRGNVTLSVTTTPPSGMTVGFSPSSVDVQDASAVSSTMTVYTMSSTPGGTYNLSVQGTDGSLNSSTTVSVTVNAPPAAPTNLKATAGDSQVSLSWGASTGATSYNVLRSNTSGSGYSQIASDVTSTSYTDTGVTNGTTYYYVVEAVDIYGPSGYSNQASATPQVATGDFSISVSPGSQMVRGSGAVTYSVSITLSGGYGGTVDLSVNGVPTGTSASFSRTSLGGTTLSSTLTVDVSTTTRGNYTLTITGKDDTTGTPTHSTTVGLKVR
jgi:kumamolisin